ncbi:MAG TPA: HNH endonuclease signature motif containing protein [Methanosarcina sp.]|nr:HNH endonuclease signature motif containing protein [Methanosarcina sp.]
MLFIDNKYTRWYYQIITNALSNIPNDYKERHHIIPKSLGGDNSKENLVDLTAREHFICHWLLTKMVAGDNKRKMSYALHAMLNLKLDVRYKNSIAYEKNKIETSRYKSIARKGKLVGKENYNFGNKWTEEQRTKMSEFRKGKNFRSDFTYSEESKIKMRESAKQRWTPEERAKFSELRRNNMHEFTCSHCGKTGKGKSNFNRWHGDNCKQYKP